MTDHKIDLSRTHPCDECGHRVEFPTEIRPGREVAKCPNCGMTYHDADAEENNLLSRRFERPRRRPVNLKRKR